MQAWQSIRKKYFLLQFCRSGTGWDFRGLTRPEKLKKLLDSQFWPVLTVPFWRQFFCHL